MFRRLITLDLSTNKGLRNFYKLYNRRYYDNRLPENVIIHFGKTPRYHAAYVDSWGEGEDRTIDIMIDERLRGMDSIVAGLAIHEMTHVDVATGHPRAEEGPWFQRRMKQLARAGALEGIW